MARVVGLGEERRGPIPVRVPMQAEGGSMQPSRVVYDGVLSAWKRHHGAKKITARSVPMRVWTLRVSRLP